MDEISENIIWELLLKLRGYVRNNPTRIISICAVSLKNNFIIRPLKHINLYGTSRGVIITGKKSVPENDGFTAFFIDPDLRLRILYDHFLGAERCRLLSLYLPVCFLPVLAHRQQRTATVLHFAQTLDGRIATVNGNSKWISNNEDLVHAHRMRALCDAVLIGSNTLRLDKPMLTVRHVQGPDPAKVVIGNHSVEFSSLLDKGGRVLYLSASGKNGYSGIEMVQIGKEGKEISPNRVLKELFSRNIFSLYVEGGSITASGFLRDYAVDCLQLFLSPKIFGSGISNFSLPEISQVKNSIKFRRSSFIPMGDGVLFCGFPES